MGRDLAKRRGALVIFAVLVLLGLNYKISTRGTITRLPVPEKTDAIEVLKVAQEETLSEDKEKKVLAMLKDARVTASEDMDEIGKEEYPDTYKLTLYREGKAVEIYYILPDGRVYLPADTKVYALKSPFLEELKGMLSF